MRAPIRSSTPSSPVRRRVDAEVVDRQVATRDERGRDEQRRGR